MRTATDMFQELVVLYQRTDPDSDHRLSGADLVEEFGFWLSRHDEDLRRCGVDPEPPA